jgi:hypothetical protein
MNKVLIDNTIVTVKCDGNNVFDYESSSKLFKILSSNCDPSKNVDIWSTTATPVLLETLTFAFASRTILS